MTLSEIARLRLLNQSISAARFSEPAKVVAWLAAVQAQDYAGAKWSLALRLRGVSEADIENAFSEGTILRTHLLRPTWHFVAATDIRWMLELTAPRVHQANAYMYRKLGLESADFWRSDAALAKALAGEQLTREELKAALKKSGVQADGEFRMSYLLMHAELEGIVCSGGRRGKSFTYALLDQRVLPSRPLRRDEALAELTRRYFKSRGPATVQDFAKWSGLTLTDARFGLEEVQTDFAHEDVGGQSYWFTEPEGPRRRAGLRAHLISIYDELISGYKDHDAISQKDQTAKLRAMGNGLTHIMLIDGQIAGTWKQTSSKGKILIKTTAFEPLNAAETKDVVKAARRYGDFHGLDVEVS
jgi:hypothetical protein